MRQYYYGSVLASVLRSGDSDKTLNSQGFWRIPYLEYLIHELIHEFIRIIQKRKI